MALNRRLAATKFIQIENHRKENRNPRHTRLAFLSRHISCRTKRF